jgi:hypothetical protein
MYRNLAHNNFEALRRGLHGTLVVPGDADYENERRVWNGAINKFPDGLTIDNLLSVEMVAADGEVLKASTTQHADLFWATRGGGGNFGIVTSFEFRLHPVGPVLAGKVVYPITKAREVLRLYREYTAQVPEELTVYASLLTTPDGLPAVAINICYCGTLDEGNRLVEPIRRLGSPMVDVIRPLSPLRLCLLLSSCLVLTSSRTSPGTLLWELRKDLLVEPRQLSCFVLDRPQEDPLNPCRLELDQFSGAFSRCSNKQSLAQQLDRATQRRTHHLHQEFFGSVPVLCQIVEHRDQRVWETLWLPSGLAQMLVQSRRCVNERRWGDVISGSEPAIPQTSHPA